MYGIATYLYQKQRITNISSQHLINLSTGEEVHSKDSININSFSEFKTSDSSGIIGFYTHGEYTFIGIGKTNNKCLIKTNEKSILIYSKGEYDVNIISSNIKKIKIKSNNGLVLKICYNNYPINKITDIISDYFKNNKIVEIINLTDNLDENWNDILSISLNNSINNNNFTNPDIKIISKKNNMDITEISNKYNFQIILDSFRKNKYEIIDDSNIISIISQHYEKFDLTKSNLLIWIMKYIETFTLSHGTFFKYYQEEILLNDEKESFINFIIAHKIASLFLKIDSNEEIIFTNILNEIIDSIDYTDIIIKNAITKFGLVKENRNNYYSYYYYN